ncbi:phenylalanine 4-monooxygenase [Alteromonas sp. KUL156]|uniref:phenylalanine 4-monooxygenase n=1 Tax=Alteromonas sp. KUL106 TaxID=2480799 RepID=UPI0012E6BFBE|nr:phenylalanine 4-monooxygenase [Alteromonas sp. KUL106]GFD68206.1 phenylalanine 4-monooxygenase [Alteromonas sp. KUL106]GFD83157.1 phenylalanine 4-monooxygenase [Tenacibaculum sp. KUL118]GFD96997.1 phenylalanine 4-monooxygenase [Alteromonas sp. KUL154]GFE02141.1 phenylalanine 4-monooxygenase [Alteromonas sp. KUL156]
MPKATQYQSRQSDDNGIIHWSEEENQIWSELYARQIPLVRERACQEYLDGLELLKLDEKAIPQLPDINKVLLEKTGWQTAEVPALINFGEFFRLLANKQFPVATFIRTREEFDYLQEPDIFHEVFGHCPLLTNPAFAHFTHTYGKLGLAASKEDRVYLARLYWFTVEFGLVRAKDELKIYGGGILSSPGETIYALDSDTPLRNPLTAIDALRTPYRIDIMQPLYYVLQEFDYLFELAEMDIMALVEKAKSLGLFSPLFPPKEKKAS